MPLTSQLRSGQAPYAHVPWLALAAAAFAAACTAGVGHGTSVGKGGGPGTGAGGSAGSGGGSGSSGTGGSGATDGPVIVIDGGADGGSCTSAVTCTPPNGRYCGVIGNGCFGMLDCGACPTGQVCEGGICVSGAGCA